MLFRYSTADLDAFNLFAKMITQKANWLKAAADSVFFFVVLVEPWKLSQAKERSTGHLPFGGTNPFSDPGRWVISTV